MVVGSNRAANMFSTQANSKDGSGRGGGDGEGHQPRATISLFSCSFREIFGHTEGLNLMYCVNQL